MALNDFVEHRLAEFGDYQDAMWTDEPFLYHSRISAAMNLKLLNPRRVLMAVEDAYKRGHAPLAAAEGFIRQILGWREYVRGIYWTFMPDYVKRNALNATEKLPDLLLGRQNRHGVPAAGSRVRRWSIRLRAPHSAPDGDRACFRCCLGLTRSRSISGIWRFTGTPWSGWRCRM